MSIEYLLEAEFILEKPLSINALVDGRMKKYHIDQWGLGEGLERCVDRYRRCLTDGIAYLWVHNDDHTMVESLGWYGGRPTEYILTCIRDEFNTEIYLASTPRYYRFSAQEYEKYLRKISWGEAPKRK